MMSHSDLARNLDSYGDGYDPSDSLDPLLEAVHALLDELHRVMPVWPATAETVALALGWDPPIAAAAEREHARDELRRQAATAPVIADSDDLEQALVRRAERAEAKALTTAEREVLRAARDLSCAQAEVEAALNRWASMPDASTEAPEYVRLTAARRARNDAADHLYNVASRDLAESPATDIPEFLRAYLPATTPVTNGRAATATAHAQPHGVN